MNSPKPLKIMVADDDASIRMALNLLLTALGHSVSEARNGNEAIEVFDREHPDLILMDVTMPIMSGYEAATIIKQHCENRFVPIIFLTGLTDADSLAKCVKSGGDTFLVKPFNGTLLSAKIDSMQRILQMQQELESYRRRTEQEIAITQHVFDSVTRRTNINIVPGLEFWSLPAGHFSGDLILYDKSPSGMLYLMLGDFTGHGFSAAIGALPTADIFFALTRRNMKPEEILAEINKKLYDVMPRGYFCATAFICCNPATHQIEIFNGGLPPVLILDSTGNIKESVESNHPPLGVLSDTKFVVESTKIEYTPEHTLLLYSDGLTDAQNDADEMFDEERLHAAVMTETHPLNSVKKAIGEFINGRTPNDDISLITLRL